MSCSFDCTGSIESGLAVRPRRSDYTDRTRAQRNGLNVCPRSRATEPGCEFDLSNLPQWPGYKDSLLRCSEDRHCPLILYRQYCVLSGKQIDGEVRRRNPTRNYSEFDRIIEFGHQISPSRRSVCEGASRLNDSPRRALIHCFLSLQVDGQLLNSERGPQR